MPGEILKTIKIDVSSAEYRALLASLEKMSELEKKIAKIQSETTGEYKQKKKVLEEQLALMRAAIAAGEKYKGLTVEETKLKAIQVNRELQLLKLNKQLSAQKQKALKDERAATLKAAQEQFAAAPAQRRRELMRAEAEKGKESSYFKAERYRHTGVAAPFMMMQESAERAGEARVLGIDEAIAQRQDKQKLNEAEMDKILGDLGDPSVKMTKAQRQAAEARVEALKTENTTLGEEIETKKDERSQAIGETKTQVSKYQAMGAAAQKVAAGLKKAAGILLKPFKDLANAAMQAVKQLLDFKTGVATYNTQGSLITNAAAREQQMKYGLTSSQNYAFTQAKGMLGIESDEDLMYMNSAQREKLLGYMNRYSAWYDQLESSGVLADIQEMQLEFQELKQELAMEFLRWVAANKETIMACIKGIFEFIKGIANVVMNIMNLLSFGRYSGPSIGEASDSTNNNYNNNQRSTVINVTANTTNNATGVLSSQDALDQYNKENFSKLAKQLATAIGG